MCDFISPTSPGVTPCILELGVYNPRQLSLFKGNLATMLLKLKVHGRQAKCLRWLTSRRLRRCSNEKIQGCAQVKTPLMRLTCN